MKTMIMSSLTPWKTRLGLLLFLLTRNITGYFSFWVDFILLSFKAYLDCLFVFRRSGSNISGFSTETGMDDQSVKVAVFFFLLQTMHQRAEEDWHILGTFSSTVWWRVFGVQRGVSSAPWAWTGQTKANPHPRQTQLLPEPVEHHEELYRKGAFKDTNACEKLVPRMNTHFPFLTMKYKQTFFYLAGEF